MKVFVSGLGNKLSDKTGLRMYVSIYFPRGLKRIDLKINIIRFITVQTV